MPYKFGDNDVRGTGNDLQFSRIRNESAPMANSAPTESQFALDVVFDHPLPREVTKAMFSSTSAIGYSSQLSQM